MDMWTELNLSTEWGLDLLDQPNGLFGDLKEVSHLGGDMDPACKPRDAVQMASPSSEDHLGFEWMESGDLGSFLDALDDGQGKLLPLEDNLFDCSQDCALKDNASVYQTKLTVKPFFDGYQIVGDDFVQGLTPPESPEQVTPVIQINSEINENHWHRDIPTPISPQDLADTSVNISTASEPSLIQYESPDFLLDGQLDVKPEILDTSDILGFSLTSYDGNVLDQVDSKDHNDSEIVSFSLSSYGDSILLSPSEASSPKPSIDNLIQSSPELYKVIATPSNLSARFSPYKSKEQKASGDAKSLKHKKAISSPEPVSEEEFSNPLGKKERKKLQNKNAAIRYRQKKKAEGECIFNEEQVLFDKNQDLRTKVDDIQREIKYMKSLMEDIYKAKGLVR